MAVKIVPANVESPLECLDCTLGIVRVFTAESVFLFVKDFIIRYFGKTEPNLFDGGLSVAVDAFRRGAGCNNLVQRRSVFLLWDDSWW